MSTQTPAPIALSAATELKLSPAQKRILGMIAHSEPVTERTLAQVLYMDASRVSPLQRPLLALADLSLITPAPEDHGRYDNENPRWRLTKTSREDALAYVNNAPDSASYRTRKADVTNEGWL